MVQLPTGFYIEYGEKKVLVSPKISATGNYFMVYLEDREVRLKSEGLKTILWIEKGKGATSLAYKLGQIIEGSRKLWPKKISGS